VLRPGVSDMIHKQSREQDRGEDTTHALQGLHPYTLNIQSSFLIKAIGVFNLGAMAPFSVHGFGIVDGTLGR
jgi:hypothetical protein